MDPTPSLPEGARESGTAASPTRAAKPRTRERNRRVQALERGASAGAGTLAAAVAAGIADWNRRQDRSARKKKDGAIRDAVRNWTRAAGKALRKASRAPEDFQDAFEAVWKGRVLRFWWPR